MARVTGIGGFFFRSLDPDALNRWYAEHLGVVMIESRTYDDPGWFQERGECGSPTPPQPRGTRNSDAVSRPT